MRYVATAKTDVGRKRKENEDWFCLDPTLGLYVVADGMGGHAAGEVASRLAVKTIHEWMKKYLNGADAAIAGPPPVPAPTEAKFLIRSIQAANQVIFDAAKQFGEYAGMGTTVVAALIYRDNVVLANVGDSRIYLINDGRIAQVSRDHSFVQHQVDCGLLSAVEAHQSQYRHMITRALGLHDTVDVDLSERRAQAGDTLLLCSDGLSDLLDDDEILATAQEHAADLDGTCQALVDRANAKGGDDNITVLLIQAHVGAATDAAPARAERASAPVESRSAIPWLKRAFGRTARD
jgi:protein phosphatase